MGIPLKIFLLKKIMALGLLDRWRDTRRHDVVFLMIHGTADPRLPAGWTPLRLQHDPQNLDRMLASLSRYYTFIGFEKAINILAGRIPPVENAIVLTFDDGYRSNLRDALPVLRKHGAPMSVFLTVSHVDQQFPMWVDRLDFALQQPSLHGRVFAVGSSQVRFSAKTRENLGKSFRRLRAKFKQEYRCEKDFHAAVRNTCELLEKEAGRSLTELFPNDPWSGIVTWDEVQAAARDGVMFGSHSVDHFRLGLLERQEAQRQLRQSREAITSKVGACRYLAYPDGNYSLETMALTRECGYEAALTTQEGRNSPGCDLMALRRINVHPNWVETELLCRVSGLSAASSLDELLYTMGIGRTGQDSYDQ